MHPPVDHQPVPLDGPTDRIAGLRVATPHRFAHGPVHTLAILTGALLLLVSGRYGYVSDELYFLAAGKYHLDWGYMDQQPLVPLLARALDSLAPGSLTVFRIPSALIMAAEIVLTAALARELGADRRAQTLAAATLPLSPWLLLSGHWLAAASVEPLQWLLVLWLTARWCRRHAAGVADDRLLLWLGLVTAIAIQTKFQIAVLCAALLGCAAIWGPRALLRRPALWIAVAGTVLAALPTLIWQHAHQWPARDMSGVVDGESARLWLLPNVLLYSGVAVGAVFCCYGTWQLLNSPRLRPFRFLGASALGVALCYLLASGRPNYLSGLYGLLFAAAAVGLQHRRERRAANRWGWVAWPVYLLSALLPINLLPVHPVSFLAAHPELPSYSRLYETGWHELAETTARVYRSLPPEVREHTAIVGESYQVAGSLDVLGRRLGLPRTYSPHRGYWFFGRPPEQCTHVLYVGSTQPLAPHFERHRRLATVHSDLENIAQGVAVTRYDTPREPWSVLWPKIRTM